MRRVYTFEALYSTESITLRGRWIAQLLLIRLANFQLPFCEKLAATTFQTTASAQEISVDAAVSGSFIRTRSHFHIKE